MSVRIPTVLLLVGSLLFGPAYSWGQDASPTAILILDPDSRFVTPAEAKDLGDHLRQLAERYPSLKVLTVQDKAGCAGAETECLVKLGQQAAAQRVLHVEIQKLPGRQLLIMRLVDVVESRELEQIRERAGKGLPALRNVMLKGWVDLMGPLFRSQIKVGANVTGASVFLDGTRIGETPLILTKELSRGRHVIEVSQEGYLTAQKDFQIDKGQDLQVEVNLDKKPTEIQTPVAALPVAVEKAGEPEAAGTKLKEDPLPVETPPLVAAGTPPPPQPAQEFLPSFDKIGESGSAAEGQTNLRQESPFYQTWWFWTAVGVVAAAGGTTALALALSGDEEGGGIPAGMGRVTIDF